MAVKAVREVSPWTIGSGVKVWEMINLPPFVIVAFKIIGAIFALLILAVQHYVITAALVVAVGLSVQFWSWWGMFAGVIPPATYWTAVVLLTLRGSEASSARSVIQGMWRIRTIKKMWQPVLFQLKVTSRVDSEAVAPLVNVKPTDSGLTGNIVTGAVALSASKLVKLEQEFASGFFCDRVTIRPMSPSMATVRFDWGQHLRSTFRLHELPSVKQIEGKPARVRFGVRADGNAATLVSNISTLVGGVSGAGKSSTMWSLIAGYHEVVPIRLRIIDPSGVEFANAKKYLGRGLVHDYVSDPKQPGARKLEEFWEDLEEDFNRRMARVEASGHRWHKPTEAEPLDVVIIDEILPLISSLKKDPMDHIVGRILYLGRKAGFVVLAASQVAQKEVIGPIRDLFPQRLCHRTGNRYMTDAFLGDGAESDGAACSMLDVERDQGVLYLAVDGQSGYTAARSAWVSDSDTGQIAQGMRPAPKVQELKTKPTSLYAFHDHRGALLYVGIAEQTRLQNRWDEHKRTKQWWGEVHQKTELYTYPDREMAETAEAVMIKKQRPKYNKQHNMS